ncbi:MAG: hypothetical protein KDD11_12525, partial [Acidobacteria bacterium]|nr:hypothetical protein [Acidobacteriota bacterium]
QRRQLAEGIEPLLSYWRHRLGHRQLVLELPTDRPRPVEPSSQGGEVPLRIPAEVVEGLAMRGREHGATLFMVAATAL